MPKKRPIQRPPEEYFRQLAREAGIVMPEKASVWPLFLNAMKWAWRQGFGAGLNEGTELAQEVLSEQLEKLPRTLQILMPEE